jgi:histone deacetylase 11
LENLQIVILSLVHTEEYLKKLNYSYHIAGILEVPCAVLLPAFLIHRRVLNPMKYATKGTIMAVDLAMEHGWAINLGNRLNVNILTS